MTHATTHNPTDAAVIKRARKLCRHLMPTNRLLSGTSALVRWPSKSPAFSEKARHFFFAGFFAADAASVWHS
jgi:hypothetical protein